MNIAIIGTGNVGKALGSSFVKGGHRVIYGAHAAGEAGGTAALSPAEAAHQADIVVIAVPYVSAAR